MKPHRIVLAGGLIVLWTAFIALAWFMSQSGNYGRIDYRVYYEAAQQLNHGQPIYQGTEGMIYLYPPLLAQILMPLAAHLTVDQVWVLWFSFNVLLLTGTVVVLSRQLPRRRMWLLVPLFALMLEGLYIGQVTILLLALFAGAWLAVKRERRLTAGALLALATWIKVFPVVVILYFLWKRDWKVVAGALVGGFALGALQVAVSGIEQMVSMAHTLFALNEAGQSWTLVRNASVLGFTTQLFGTNPQVTPLIVSPTLYLITRTLIMLALIGSFLFVTARSNDFDLGYGLAILTSMLISPTLFPVSMPPLLLTYFLLLRPPRLTPRRAGFVLLASMGLLCYWLFVIGYTGIPPISGVVLSFGFYVLIITWSVNAWLLWRSHPVAEPEEDAAVQENAVSR